MVAGLQISVVYFVEEDIYIVRIDVNRNRQSILSVCIYAVGASPTTSKFKIFLSCQIW